MSKIQLKYPAYVPFSVGQGSIAAFAIALLVVVQQYIQHVSSGFDFAFSWDIMSMRAVANYLLWLPVVPLIARLLQPLFLQKKDSVNDWARLIGFSLLVAVTHRFLAVWIFDGTYSLLNGSAFVFFRPANLPVLWAGLFSSVFQVAAIVGVIGGISYYQRFIKQKTALVQAELKALKMQLHPHFLFNTFHSISALIDIDTEAAQLMLTRLSFLLRALLEKEQEQKISLKEELEFTRHYLGIEQVRFQDRLAVKFNIQPDTLNASVPTLILQPLVENALKHGISQLTHDGRLTVISERLGRHTLKLMIEDNGPGISVGKEGFGVGLPNVRQRLEQLYGTNFSLEAFSLPERGYRVTILIPLEVETKVFHAYTHPNR